MDALLTSEQLSSWCGYERRTMLIQWLDKHGIQWVPDRHGWPCTTLRQVEKAFSADENTQEVRFG